MVKIVWTLAPTPGDTKTFNLFRDVDIQNREEICRCTFCENASSFIDEHMEHYEEYHASIDTSISCKFGNCDFKADLPENMIKYIMREHHK